MPATKSLIQKFTLTSDAAFIEFTNIPQTYTDLNLVFSLRSSRTSDVRDTAQIRLNGSTSSIYSYRTLSGNGSSAGSDSASSATLWANLDQNSSTSTSNTFGYISLYIPNYANTTINKSASADSAYEANATLAYIRAAAFLWNSTNAVTSIRIFPEIGPNWVIGSSAYLYGIQASPNTPILTQGTQTLTSTAVTISNYNAALTYTVTASAGTASRSGDTITVTGLSAGQTITVTVTAVDSNGYTSATASGSFAASPVASGGTITEAGGFRIHTFDSAGTFILNAPRSVDYLLVGGGTGGRGEITGNGGGTGGLLLSGSTSLSSNSYPITVGGGGSTEFGSGTASTLSSIASSATGSATGAGGANRNSDGPGNPGSSGISNSITTSAITYGGGGGGGAQAWNGANSVGGGAGGASYGGGGGSAQNFFPAFANAGGNGARPGGGGGGSGFSFGASPRARTGGSGGGGTVIIRYAI